MPPTKRSAAAAKPAADNNTPSGSDPTGEAPGRLLFAQDGRVITPDTFGGPGGPAADGTVVLGLQDPSLTPAPRQEVQQADLASNHAVVVPSPEDDE